MPVIVFKSISAYCSSLPDLKSIFEDRNLKEKEIASETIRLSTKIPINPRKNKILVSRVESLFMHQVSLLTALPLRMLNPLLDGKDTIMGIHLNICTTSS